MRATGECRATWNGIEARKGVVRKGDDAAGGPLRLLTLQPYLAGG